MKAYSRRLIINKRMTQIFETLMLGDEQEKEDLRGVISTHREATFTHNSNALGGDGKEEVKQATLPDSKFGKLRGFYNNADIVINPIDDFFTETRKNTEEITVGFGERSNVGERQKEEQNGCL